MKLLVPRTALCVLRTIIIAIFMGSNSFAFQQTHYPVTVKDDAEQKVTLRDFPKHIVVGGDPVPRILSELGMKECIIGALPLSHEEAIKQNVDLMIVNGTISADEAKEWRKRHIPLYLFRPLTMAHLYADIRDLGRICNRNNASYALNNRIRRHIQFARKGAAKTCSYSDWIYHQQSH